MQGSGLLQAAMRDNDQLLLAGYVKALRAKGVPEAELAAEYERLRQQFPDVPSLEELDAQRAAAEQR